ncbi:MAG TPA: lysozyme inhibitor LprI family protein [Azospirillum sp.]|nr:lysozyme inhibitor LprI family protein [Azospirillum sp.]
MPTSVRRNLRRNCLAGAAFVLSFAAGPALAQSFDCAKAATQAEKTICASSGLRSVDEQLAQTYADLLGYSAPGDRDSTQKAQAAWLAQRDKACADKAKANVCAATYDRRTEELVEALRTAQKRIGAIVAGIPKDPKGAATALARYEGAAAKAWLAYLYHSGTVAVPDRQGEVRRLVAEVVDTGLPKNDPYLLEEVKNLGEIADGPTENMLMFLRHVLSLTDLEAPCFLFTKHGQTAFEAFGPFWGSTRDATPEVCHDVKSVYDLPEWKKLATHLDPAIAPALDERGSIRIGYERQFMIDALQASLVPSTLLEAPHSAEARKMAEARTKAVAAFHAWKDFDLWPESEVKAAKAALPFAIAATSKLYREKFGLAANIADQAARAAGDRFIASRLSLLMPDD